MCVFYLQVRHQWTHKVLILCRLCTQDKVRNPRPSWIGTNKYPCPLLVVFEYVFLSCIAMIFNMISVIVHYFLFTLVARKKRRDDMVKTPPNQPAPSETPEQEACSSTDHFPGMNIFCLTIKWLIVNLCLPWLLHMLTVHFSVLKRRRISQSRGDNTMILTWDTVNFRINMSTCGRSLTHYGLKMESYNGAAKV